MSKSNAFETALLQLLFNATAFANFADNAASAPVTNLYVSLHSADPGEAGDQTTNEVTYTSYARVAVARTSGGWTITANSVSPVANIDFPTGTGGSGSALFFGVGKSISGAGVLLYSGPLGSNLGPFTGAVSGNTITIPGLTGVAVNDQIAFFASQGSSLPTGITEGTAYFVKTLSADVITIAATSGGTVITLSASGDGVAYKINPIVLGNGITPRLPTTTAITED